jgi:hypothetical protein
MTANERVLTVARRKRYPHAGKFPNRYAKYFQQRQGERDDGVALDMRDVLEMKGLFRKGVVTPTFLAHWQVLLVMFRALPGPRVCSCRHHPSGNGPRCHTRGPPR